MADTVKVLLADDHQLVREAIRRLLNATPDFKVVEEASNGIDAMNDIVRGRFDLIVLDVVMPGMTGLEVAHEIAARNIDTPYIMLSGLMTENSVFTALKLGARGYVHKTVSCAELISVCRGAVRRHEFAAAGNIGKGPVDTLVAHEDRDNALDALLSRREQQIARMIADGMSGVDISKVLFLSPKTVERHRSNILHKLGMTDRVQLTRFAIRTGLIEP